MKVSVARRASEAEPVLHPETGAEWFSNLSPAKQEELHATFQRSADHDQEIVVEGYRRLRTSCLQSAALFGIIDLCCPSSGWWTFLALAASGAGLGAALHRIRAGRLSSGTLSLLAFVVMQVLTRGGLGALHFFWLFPVGAIAAIQGLRREFGD